MAVAFELIYTSVPRGIRPGSSGFCIVAYTNGLAANIALQLEGLSAYKPYFPHYDENAARNPVAFSHYLYSASREEMHILSRVCFNGLDYTKRSNKLAHHLVMGKGEMAAAQSGPSTILKQDGLFLAQWQGEPQLFPRQKEVDAPSVPLRKASAWEACAGDAGWAGVLAQRYLDSPEKPAFVIFDPLRHENMLELVEEALLLLPPSERWKVSFNTYFTTLPAGIKCLWRFCIPGSDALREARRTPGALVIDLTKQLPLAPAGGLPDVARTGVPKVKVSMEASPRPLPALASTARTEANPASQKPDSARPRTQSVSQERKSSASKIWAVAAVVILLALGAGGYFGFTQFKNSMAPQSNQGSGDSVGATTQIAGASGIQVARGGSSLQESKAISQPQNKRLSTDLSGKIEGVDKGISEISTVDAAKAKAGAADIAKANAASKEKEDADTKKKEEAKAEEMAQDKKRLEKIRKKRQELRDCLWLYWDFKDGKLVLNDLLETEEKIEKIKIKGIDEEIEVKDGFAKYDHKSPVFPYNLIDTINYIFQVENCRITIVDESNSINKYPIERLIITGKKELYTVFKGGVSRMPPDEDARLELKHNPKTLQLQVVYTLSDADSESRKIMEVYDDSQFVIELGNKKEVIKSKSKGKNLQGELSYKRVGDAKYCENAKLYETKAKNKEKIESLRSYLIKQATMIKNHYRDRQKKAKDANSKLKDIDKEIAKNKNKKSKKQKKEMESYRKIIEGFAEVKGFAEELLKTDNISTLLKTKPLRLFVITNENFFKDYDFLKKEVPLIRQQEEIDKELKNLESELEKSRDEILSNLKKFDYSLVTKNSHVLKSIKLIEDAQ
jgi:hypothetical protein